ncbi:MAG TPA: hypothetical protein VFV87_05295 [Pirellulaceae bacterium]|nr:hypothetical protein [Pirellulaceae bacterium]
MIQHALKPPSLEMFEVTDPVELAAAAIRRTHFDRNSAWLQQHIKEVGADNHRGKFYCIAGQQAFVGDTVEDVVARAKAAHPDDQGWFTGYVPRERVPRIYAC